MFRADVLSARGPTTSASQSSLASIKEGIQRVLGGTPPPPYEVSFESAMEMERGR